MARLLQRIASTEGMAQLQLANAAFAFAEHSTWLALMVYAYTRGGAPEAGLVGFVLLLPSTITAPIGGAVAQRLRPQVTLAVTAGLLVIANVATAAAMWAGASVLAYIAGGVTAALITVPRPVTNALLPSLAKTPQDLVAANVATSVIEQTGRCIGPIGAGAIIALASPAGVFVAAAIATVVSGAAALRLPEVADPAEDTEREPVFAELRRGFGIVRHAAKLRWLLVVVAMVAMCNGVIDVLAVTFAETRLGMGEAAAGWLMSAFGLGAILGGAAASGLVGGSKMSSYFAAAGALIGLTFGALGGVTFVVLGLIVFAANGAGQALVSVVCNVGIQRHAPSDALARVFGVAEGTQQLGLAVGSLLFARLAATFSLSTTLIVLAAAVLLTAGVALLRLVSLRVLDAPPPADLFERIAADPLFAPLGLPRLERLATLADRVAVAAGAEIIREGEPGEDYYLIHSGEVSITVGGQRVRRMGPGESFGEIALLLDSPRTATITAIGDVQLLRISRDEFMQALSLNTKSRGHAGATAERYLAEDLGRRNAEP